MSERSKLIYYSFSSLMTCVSILLPLLGTKVSGAGFGGGVALLLTAVLFAAFTGLQQRFVSFCISLGWLVLFFVSVYQTRGN